MINFAIYNNQINLRRYSQIKCSSKAALNISSTNQVDYEQLKSGIIILVKLDKLELFSIL